MSKSLKINLIILGIAGLILAGSFYSSSIKEVKAQAPTDTYGVYVDSVTGMISGYAWSDNIGWIKFGGLSSFPVGDGTVSQNAQLVSDKIIGWARACAGTASGDCSTMDSRIDGWDGWISLSGTGYGISVDSNGNLSGYAWGSDVVGWIDFTGVKLSAAPIVPIEITLTAASSSIISGDSTMITWNVIGADTCTVSANGVAFGTGISNTKSSGALTSTTDFVAQCNNSGNTATKSMTVVVTTPPPPAKPRGPGNSDCTDPAGCEFIWTDQCTLTEGDLIDSDYVLNCTNPGMPLGPDNPVIINVPQQQKSGCLASQGTSSTMYTNRNTKWELKNSGGQIGKIKWTGTNISTIVTQPGSALNKIYTTIGKKTISGITIITRPDNTTFISGCVASTTIERNPGTGTEI